ncbi:lactonase family protein [Cyclobacterium plantarum]|uniref:lactonase family protein n=1 Tax=Cyclobacterium plantarum TaxID=2716263 RepID=UPI003F6FA760
MKINKMIVVVLIAMACGQSNTRKSQTITNDMSDSYLFLLGTYTDTPEQGIHLLEFNPGKNGFNLLSSATDPENPSFVIANKSQNLVFSVEETAGDEGGKVSSFALNEGHISKINTVSAAGDAPCYLSLDPSEKFVVAANYSEGNFSVIPVEAEGRLQPAVQVVNHKGNSINPNRQKQPHVHAVVFHPQDGRLLVADLGTDEVVVYNFNPNEEKPLVEDPHFRLQVKPGAGPRHMVFDAVGETLYLIHEITAEIGIYRYDDGFLEHVETQSLLEQGFTGTVGAAEVRIYDKFLYASNRGEANEIIGFQIVDQGKLKHIQTISSGGNAPRNFNITPDGKFLVVGNQNSNTLLAFSRDPESGMLTNTDHRFEIHKPVYINFLP